MQNGWSILGNHTIDKAMRTVIIEDEVVAARALETLVCEVFPDLIVSAVLQSVDESVEWFRENAMPDLVFMDIHLADGSSFSIFDEVDVACPVIFTTAYDEYALKAFEVNSIDYLLKPINKKDLERAIAKFRNISRMAGDTQKMMARLLADIRSGSPAYKSSFLISEKDKLVPLSVNDIAYIYVDAKMVAAVTFDDRRRYLEQSLNEVMEQLDPHDFYRANRQFIVSRQAIKDISMWFGSKLAINLSVATPERVYISKARVREFKNWLTE